MALKDWRVHKNKRENFTFIKKDYPQVIVNGYKSLRYDTKKGKTIYFWEFQSITNRTFKTKSEALKFAESYMRKH